MQYKTHNRNVINQPRWPVHSLPLPLIGCTSNNIRVYERPNPHYHDMPDGLLNEVLGKIRLGPQSFVKTITDMGRVIGNSTCVGTTSADKVQFAQRLGRRGLTRFVLNRESEACSTIVTVFKKRDDMDNSYILLTAFIGGECEPEPWDLNATSNSKAFWNTHALIWGEESYIPGTVTEVCPW